MPAMRRLLLPLALLCTALGASAAEIRVLAAGALKPLVTALAPDFERETGHRIVVEGDTAGALARRVLAGDAFDVVIVTQSGIGPLQHAGRLSAAAPLPLARVGIGVAVKAGAAQPDIHDEPALRRALLDARAVAMIDAAAGGSSGIYLAGLFERMGIAPQVKRKAVLVPGGLTALKLVSGEADIALQQMSELLVVPGVTVLGPLPAEVQNYTLYVGAVGAAARDAAAARAWLDAMRGPRAAAWMQGKGLEAP